MWKYGCHTSDSSWGRFLSRSAMHPFDRIPGRKGPFNKNAACHQAAFLLCTYLLRFYWKLNMLTVSKGSASTGGSCPTWFQSVFCDQK